MRFDGSDGWLLYVLYFRKNVKMNRSQVRNLGDALNKAVFSDDEIDHGMIRLKCAGYADRDEKEFWITPKGVRFVQNSRGFERKETIGSMLNLMDAMRQIEVPGLQEMPPDPIVWGPFDPFDAKFLLKLFRASRPNTRQDLFVVGDDMPGGSQRAYGQSFMRLKKAGLADAVDGGYAISEQGIRFVEKCTQSWQSHDLQVEAIIRGFESGV